MTDRRQSRRWFLQGVGGATLAIPAMTSLLPPKEARAALAGQGRIFIGVMSQFGGVWTPRMFPTLPTGAESMTYRGRSVRRGMLAAQQSGGNTSLSEVLTAPSALLSPALVAKMSLLQGLDIPFDTNHHAAATFGNYAQGDGKAKSGPQNATIDQVIAQSPAFYRDLAGITQRSVQIAHIGAVSFASKVPGKPGSGVQRMPAHMSPESLWAALFGSAKPAAPGMATERASIVDLVYEDYTRQRANAKLSAGDKLRLDEHVARIADIRRRMSVSTTACAAPGKPAKPPGPGCSNWQSHVEFFRSFQDVVVAALACGLTRVVTQFHSGWSTSFGDRCESPWHQAISHAVSSSGPQAAMTAAMQRQFAGLIVPLAAKLDAVKDAGGTSLLDRSLLYWTQEHGVFSHAQENIPVVTFGSAGGAFRTGQHFDYRDMTRPLAKGQFGETLPDKPHVGLTWHQLLGSVARGFEIPHAEWAQANHGGFGLRPANLAGASYRTRYTNWGNAEWDAAGEPLPWWTV